MIKTGAKMLANDQNCAKNRLVNFTKRCILCILYKLFSSAAEVLETEEKKKIAEYGERVALMGEFVPLACSIYGTLAPVAMKLAVRASRRVDPDREERDAVMDLHRVMVQVGIIKATSICLRGRCLRAVPKPLNVPQPIPDRTSALADAGLRDPFHLDS